MMPASQRAAGSCARSAARAVLGPNGAQAFAVALSAVAGIAAAADPSQEALVSYRVVADGIPEPLAVGDAARGRTLLAARDPANCVLCHAVPDAAIPFAGNVGPPLAGVGARLSAPQLRLRVVDNLRVNPQTIMPSYYKVAGLEQVASAFRGKAILTAPQVEDVVAYLATLR
jgi:sulfur-oxidizing protein SoxX